MNLSPEAFERVLTELADRADGHQVIDRVPTVRGRARRNARLRAAALAATLTVLIVIASGLAGFGGLPMLRGQGAGPAEKPALPGPYLNIQLERDEKKEATLTSRIAGGRVVAINVILQGRVPQWSGYQAGAPVTDNLWEMLFTPDNTDGVPRALRATQEGFHCDPDAPLVDINTSRLMTVSYEPGFVTPIFGAHEVRFTAGACAPVGLVQQKLTYVVKK